MPCCHEHSGQQTAAVEKARMPSGPKHLAAELKD
jgi:hypothetical protein